MDLCAKILTFLEGLRYNRSATITMILSNLSIVAGGQRNAPTFLWPFFFVFLEKMILGYLHTGMCLQIICDIFCIQIGCIIRQIISPVFRIVIDPIGRPETGLQDIKNC